MRFANPTSVQIGMTGSFVGIRYRVVGRVVMGMEDGGATYYWQEFNLAGDQGQCATLVYERTERGPEWKLFTLFEPETPISVEEARRKKVGDTINFYGAPMKITLVDDSRVHFIEGLAPEGVEVGDIAYYFNAETRKKMVVVSWTGDEIEFYQGMHLPGGMVPQAFGLLRAVHATQLEDDDDVQPLPWPKLLLAAFIAIFMAFFVWSTVPACRPSSAIVKPALTEAPLEIGRRGKLDGRYYTIAGRTVVEIAQVGRLLDHYEYRLVDEDDGTALLFRSWQPKAKEWFVLTPFEPAQPITAARAAALGRGNALFLDGSTYEVTDLFRSTILQGGALEASSPTNTTVFYGLSAGRQTYRVFVRWNEEGITFHHGKMIPEKSLNAAFKKK